MEPKNTHEWFLANEAKYSIYENDYFVRFDPQAMLQAYVVWFRERAGAECDAEAESIVTCLNPTSAVNALRYAAERIRALD